MNDNIKFLVSVNDGGQLHTNLYSEDEYNNNVMPLLSKNYTPDKYSVTGLQDTISDNITENNQYLISVSSNGHTYSKPYSGKELLGGKLTEISRQFPDYHIQYIDGAVRVDDTSDEIVSIPWQKQLSNKFGQLVKSTTKTMEQTNEVAEEAKSTSLSDLLAERGDALRNFANMAVYNGLTKTPEELEEMHAKELEEREARRREQEDVQRLEETRKQISEINKQLGEWSVREQAAGEEDFGGENIDWIIKNAGRKAELRKKRAELVKQQRENPMYRKEEKRIEGIAEDIRDKAYKVTSDISVEGDLVTYNNPEADTWRAARYFADNALKTINAPDDNENGFSAFLKGAGDTFSNVDFWTMGLVSISSNFKVKRVFSKIADKVNNYSDKTLGETDFDNILTDAEKELIKSFVSASEAQALRAYDTNNMYKAGTIAADSVGFMAQFILTGGVGGAFAGATKTAAKGFAKWIAKNTGKVVKRAAIGTAVASQTLVGRGAMKLADAVATPVLKAVPMTLMQTGLYKNYAEKLTERDNAGNLTYDYDTAILPALRDAGLEVWSEMALAPVLAVFGKTISKGIANLPKTSKVGAFMKAKLDDITSFLHNREAIDILTKAGFDGYFEEIGEEILAAGVSSMWEPEAWSQFWEKDNLVSMAVAFAPMSVIGGGMSMANYVKRTMAYEEAAPKVRDMLLNRTNITEAQLNALFDRKSATMQDIADKISDIVKPIIESGAISADEFKALYDFAGATAQKDIAQALMDRMTTDARNNMRAELNEKTGGKTIYGKDKDGNETVSIYTDANGKKRYVIIDETSEDTLALSMDEQGGNIKIVDPSELEITTMPANQYLDAQVTAAKQVEEQNQIAQQQKQQKQSVMEALKASKPVKLYSPVSNLREDYIFLGWDGDMAVVANAQTGDEERRTVQEMANALNISPSILTKDQQTQMQVEKSKRYDSLARSANDYKGAPISYGDVSGSLLRVKSKGDEQGESYLEAQIVTESGEVVSVNVTPQQIEDFIAERKELIANAGAEANDRRAKDRERKARQAKDAEQYREAKAKFINPDGSIREGEWLENDPRSYAIYSDGKYGKKDTDATLRAALTKAQERAQKALAARDNESNPDFKQPLRDEYDHAVAALDTLDGLIAERSMDESASGALTPEQASEKFAEMEQMGLTSDEIIDLALQSIEETQARIDSIAKPQVSTDIPAYMEEKRKYAELVAAEQKKIDYWRSILNAPMTEQERQNPDMANARMRRRMLDILTEKQSTKDAETLARLDAELQQVSEGFIGRAIADINKDNDNVVIATEASVADRMRELGSKDSTIEQVLKAIADGDQPRGFFDTDTGVIFMVAENNYDVRDSQITFVHERQHKRTRARGLASVLIDRLGLSGLSEEEQKSALLAEMHKLFRGNFYDGKSALTIADELISYGVERVFRGDIDGVGLNETITNFVKNIDNERGEASNLSGAGAASHGGASYRVGADGNAAIEGVGTTEVGGQGAGTAVGGEEESEGKVAYANGSPIQGLEAYSRDELKRLIENHIANTLSENGIDADIVAIELYGSRGRGTAREDSDLDAVVEYRGDIREDSMFNILNDEDSRLVIDGTGVDINPIRAEETGTMESYMKRSQEYDAQKIQQAALDLVNGVKTFQEEDGDVRFSIRTKPAPKNTGIGYKVFYLKDGKLYPPMVANPDGADTPVGVWLDADAAPQAATSKTGRKKVKAGGKGTQGGSGTLAYRPGWHLGEIPYALQFNRGPKVDNPLGITGKNGKVIKVGKYFPANFVWAEVEYAKDVDYQDEAMSYGYNEAGNFQHSLAGLPKVPEDGSYTYRTNANPATDPWIITGAMKVNRVLTDSEVDELVRQAGREPQLREGKTEKPRDVRENNEPSFRVVNNNQQVFISNALASLDKIPMKSGNAQAWINKIQQAGGLKKEEDKWIGLTDWLKEQQGDITKEDVAEYIREHQVQIEEVNYEDVPDINGFEGLDFYTTEYNELLDMYAEEDNPADYAKNEMEARHGSNFWFHFFVNGAGEVDVDQESFDTYDEMFTTLQQYGVYPNQDVNSINPIRLNYTTEGLQENREIALVVPDIAPYKQYDDIHFGDAGEGRAVAWIRFGSSKYYVPEYDNFYEFKKRMTEKYFPGTFGYNIPDLSKLTDEERAEYERLESIKKGVPMNKSRGTVLVIDEIQSKRHQDGKEIGYDSVPDAPFRDSWDALAMKRMLRLAAEEGYDKIAWTSGQMQSDRYGLTKNLSDFYYKPNEDGTYKVSAALNQRRPGYTDYSDLNLDSLTVDGIGKIFGKEIAAKVSEGKGRKGYSHNNEGEWITFSGRNLKMANEGMRYFYDQRLVNWMNKYGKKWGVQVADLTLMNLENKEGWHSIDITPEMKESVMEGQPMFSVGGNSGYVGYSMSKRAANAREEGAYPKTDFKQNYGISQGMLDALVSAGAVDNTEWHHTSKYGNKTTFYRWNDFAYKAFSENRESVESIYKDKSLSKEEKVSQIENIINTAIVPIREQYDALASEYEAVRQSIDILNKDREAERNAYLAEVRSNAEDFTASNGAIVRIGEDGPVAYDADGNRLSKRNGREMRDAALKEYEDNYDYYGSRFNFSKQQEFSDAVGRSIDLQSSMTSLINAERESAGGALFRATEIDGNPSLIAVHNLTENNLLDAFDLGGFPMPSIAITKAEVGHTNFGDISLVFDKETINPKNRKNKVYSGDAWTPTFPKIGYKLNYDKTREIYWRAIDVGDLPFFIPSRFERVNYEDNIDDMQAKSLIDNLKKDYGAKQFFLAEQGNPIREYEMHEVDKYTEEQVRRFKEVLEKIGLENLKGVDKDLTPEILRVVRETLDVKSNIEDDIIKKIARRYVVNAVDYATHGNKKSEVDYDATKRKIDERIDQSAFEKWLEDLFSGIVEKGGIRNEVDPFTPIGNRRAWEKLYDEVTLDNVVKAMSKKPKRGGSGFFGGNIFGASAKTYNSISDIRKEAASRLAAVKPEEIEKQKQAILDRLSEVKVTNKELGITEIFDLTENIKDAVANSHTADGIHRYLKDYYPDITMDAAQEIADIVKDIQSLSTKYFEAKPYRAVGFDEVKLAIVPEGTSQAVVDGLLERGVPVRTYEKNNQQERMDIISNATEEMGLRFAIEITPEVRDEMYQIEALARLRGKYLKAPKGEDTNLNPEQWALVRTKNYTAWFGDWENDPENASKVLDENGEPMVMYHGGKGEITTFNPARIGSNIDNGTMGAGFYFTSDKQNADNYARNAEGEGPVNTTSVYLNIRNPKRVRWNELSGDNKKESEAFTAKAKAQGYDGFIAEAVNGATWYVAFEPNQIKSATENNGEFSRENDDIRFSIKAEPDMDNATLRSMMENVYSADTMKEIVYEIFKRVAKGNLSGASIPIGKITDFGIDYLKEVTGKDFGKSTQFVLNLPDLKHIFDRHYETDRYPNNARALNENDIKAIVDLMMAPESIAPVSGSDNKYWFFMPNGVEVSVLLDVKGKKKLMPKSYYIAKAGNMSSNNDYVNRIQVATSKTRTTNPAYEANIPPIFDFANSFSNEDIKKVEGAASFRVSPAQDAEYMSAVEAGDIDKAERMVRDAAMARDGIILNESGNPRVLYHGTNQFGFTEFAPIKAAAIWTSTARNVAANYAGDGNYASVREIRKGYSGLDTTDGIIADMEYLTGQKWRRVTDEERQNLIDDIEQRAVEICSKFNGVAEYELPGDEEERTKAENAISWVENLFWELADAKANGWSNDDRYNYIKPSVEQYREHRALLRDYRDKYYGELSGSTKELIDYLLHWEVGDLGTVASYSYLAAVKPGDALTTDYDGSSMVTPESLRNTIQRNLKIGAYQLFGFADNILEVDCKNNAWYNLDFNGMHNTDEIAVWAKQNGYDAVHFKNLYDYGDLADDYCFFSPNQVKSADPVTYDDNGKIIPLSERFNTESDDIRFRISGENATFAEEDANELANDIANEVYRQISSQENSGNLATEMDSESDGEVLFRFIGEIGADRLDKTDGGRRILNLIEAKKYYTPESAENIKRAYGWELDKDAKGNPVWKYEENDFGIKDFNIKDGANLSDVIDDEGLFAAYPELKNYTLAIEDLKDSVGYFNEANKKIALEKDAEKEEARLTLIHEIQHFIQSKEGWVRGTSAKNPLILDTVKDIFPYIREDLNMFLMSAAKRIFNKSYKKESISNFRFFKDKWGFDPIEYLFDLKKTNYLAYEAYLRKAGEVEARNAERRADMTELERRRSLASETEDRPRSRQWRETPYEDVMFSVSPATQLRKKGLADSLTEEQMSSIANDAFASMDEQTRRKIAAEQIRLGGDLVQPVMDYISRIAETPDSAGISQMDADIVEGVRQNLVKMVDAEDEDITTNDTLWLVYDYVHGDDTYIYDAIKNRRIRRALGQARSVAPEMSLDDYLKAAEEAKDDIIAEYRALRKLADSLTSVMDAMEARRDFDRVTVGRVVKLANSVISSNLLDDMTKGEVKRITGVIRRATGMRNIQTRIYELYNIILNNNLRRLKNLFEKELKRKASKVGSKNVVEQGRLDLNGQKIMAALKDNLDKIAYDDNGQVVVSQALFDRINDAMDRAYSEDKAVSNDAELELIGLSYARQYIEGVAASEKEEQDIKDSLKEADQSLADGTLDKKSHGEFVKEQARALAECRTERVKAFTELVQKVQDMSAASHDLAIKFVERNKERIAQIHHEANSDLEGVPANEHPAKPTVKDRLINSSVTKFFLRPLGTFDMLLRMLGRMSPNGEGYLWNRFMRGWIDATSNEYTGIKNAKMMLDAKVSEIFGRKMVWSDLYAMVNRMPKATVKFWDGGEMREHEVTQGNLLYIMLADQMTDGRMKLRAMGITEDDVDAIRAQMDSRFISLADWIVHDFLPSRREAYNAVHERMFGAPMSKVQNYFPLRILSNARTKQVDVATGNVEQSTPSTVTGNIMKRTRNALALDIMGTDAFVLVMDHVQKMEHWAAFAEWNRDLSDLLSYKRFRNKVQNMTSIYGAKNDLYNEFVDVAMIAAGSYRTKSTKVDVAAGKLAKGVTGAKISFRLYTALKQLQSAIAYFSDANPIYIAEGFIKGWKWSKENLPMFEKRIKARDMGDQNLSQSTLPEFLEKIGTIGMSPNVGVDAFTVSAGAYALYKTKYENYIKMGFSKEAADKRAKQDAVILYNETQQSSEAAFLSTLQADRTWLSKMLSVFRNSSFAYTRQVVDASRNLAKRAESGYKRTSIEYLTKQLIREGLSDSDALRAAKDIYNRQGIKDALRLAIYGYILPMTWGLLSSLPYLIFGDDDDKKEEMVDEAMLRMVFGPIEGLAAGNTLAEFGYKLSTDMDFKYVNNTQMPIVSDITNVITEVKSDSVRALNDIVNLATQMLTGANPQTFEDAIIGIIDACNGDLGTTKEALLLALKVINAPQSSIDQLYLDEIDMSAKEASELSIPELASRYAKYKKMRNAGPFTPLYSFNPELDEKTTQKYIRQFESKAKERMKIGEENDYAEISEEAKALNDRISSLRKKAKEDDPEADRQLMEIFMSPDYAPLMRFYKLNEEMNSYINKAIRAKSNEEMADYLEEANRLRGEMMEDYRNDPSEKAYFRDIYARYSYGILPEMSRLDKKYKEEYAKSNPDYLAWEEQHKEERANAAAKAEANAQKILEIDAQLKKYEVTLPNGKKRYFNMPERKRLYAEKKRIREEGVTEKQILNRIDKTKPKYTEEDYMPEDIYNSPEYQIYLEMRELGSLSGNTFKFKSIESLEKQLSEEGNAEQRDYLIYKINENKMAIAKEISAKLIGDTEEESYELNLD